MVSRSVVMTAPRAQPGSGRPYLALQPLVLDGAAGSYPATRFLWAPPGAPTFAWGSP